MQWQDADDGNERNADDRQADGNLDHRKTGLTVPSSQSTVAVRSRWTLDSGLWTLDWFGIFIAAFDIPKRAARQPFNVNDVYEELVLLPGGVSRMSAELN